MNILYNAHFYVNGSFDNQVQALLVDDGKIIELLDTNPKHLGDLDKIDLRGGHAYPGFIDSHTHSFSGGLYTGGIDLFGCTSIDEVLSLLAQAKKERDQYVFAWRFDENKTREKRFPTVRELDSACGDPFLLLRRIDGHSCILNSRARDFVPNLHSKTEILTGQDNDLAVNWLQDNCDDQTILQAYHAAAEVALKGGFTKIHTMIGDADQSNQHYQLMRDHLDEFAVRFELYPQSFNIQNALELGAKRIGGCILADGSIGSHTSALSEPYIDKETKGILYHSNGFWEDFITGAHDHGLQVCVHCIGDAAIRQINNAYAKLDPSEVSNLRHQLIHCEMTPDDLLDEIARSQATPVMQPNFDLLWGGSDGLYAQRLGLERVRMMNCFASFARRDVRICGSSDWYVTDLNIAMSLHAAINHQNPDERLSPAQAIRLYTENNAWLNLEEDSLGKIEPGYIADLSVMNTDFTRPFDYHDAKTMFVIRGGEIVYA
jgi:predicted amidohydrolase YtcJ